MARTAVWPLLLGTGVLFGLGIPLSQVAQQHGVGLLAFAVWGTAAAAVGLAAVAWLRHGPLRAELAVLRFGLLTGVLGHALPASAGYWLASETGPGFAAIAYTLPPVLTLALSIVLGLERPAVGRIAAVALGLVGALLLVASRVADLDVELVAIGLLLVIPLSIAGANVYRALHLPKTVPAEWLAALMLSCSALVLAASGAARGGIALPVDAEALVWPALQAAASIASYLLFFALQRRAGPVTTSFVGYVSMITGTIVAAVGFGEHLPVPAWPALGLIAGSVWLLQKSTASSYLEETTHAASPPCSNDHCAVSADHSMAFDCSAKGLLPCA